MLVFYSDGNFHFLYIHSGVIRFFNERQQVFEGVEIADERIGIADMTYLPIGELELMTGSLNPSPN